MNQIIETQRTVSDWAEATFGPASSDARVAARIMEELAELLREITSEAVPSRITDECADVAIILCRLGMRRGASLSFTGTNSVNTLYRLAGALSTRLGLIFYECCRGDYEASVSEIGDMQSLMGTLNSICKLYDTTLAAAVQAKMEVNRAREWALTDDGHGYHVRKKEG